jgi:hypothetical protein
MSHWILAGVVVVAMSTAACASSSDSKPETDNTQTTTADAGGAAEAGAEPTISLSDSDIEALQVDGVWVFRYDPNGGMTALHGGEAAIVDSCLLVGDCIMVWPFGRFGEAKDAIAAVRAGEAPMLTLGGGGQSLEEDGVLPAVVVDHCQTTCVWFVSPVVR